MFYLQEVPDNNWFLDSHLDEISTKTDKINAVAGRLDEMPMFKVETLKDKITQLIASGVGIGR